MGGLKVAKLAGHDITGQGGGMGRDGSVVKTSAQIQDPRAFLQGGARKRSAGRRVK